MSSANVFHNLMLELPVKTIPPSFGGWTRSASSNARMEDSHGPALLIRQKEYPTMQQPNSTKTRRPKRVFFTLTPPLLLMN